jgi:exosome complex RNA-binding protein Rrp42 (RNase PH superfamily)
MLDKVLRRSDAVDKESLCILAGERVNNLAIHREYKLIVGLLLILKVWALRLTIHCLADAGNMLDCACLAGIVALKHFRRPEVEVIGDEVIVVSLILAVYVFFSLILYDSTLQPNALLYHYQSTTAPSVSHSPFSLLHPPLNQSP